MTKIAKTIAKTNGQSQELALSESVGASVGSVIPVDPEREQV